MPIAYFAFALLGFIWGWNFLYMKWACELISPQQVTLLRVAVAFGPLLAYAWFRGDIRREHARHWPHFLVMSVLATSFYYFAYAKGTSLLYSGIAGALSGSIPLFSFIVAYFFLAEETITVRKAAGVLLGLAGVLIIARPWESGPGGVDIMGVVYMTLGSLSVGGSFVYARKFLSHLGIPSAALTTYQMGLALVTLAVFTSFDGITAIGQDTHTLWGLILGLGILGTGVAYMLYYFLVRELGAITASGATYIPPVMAVIIGFFIAGEPITLMDAAAMGTILVGITLLRAPAARRNRRAR